MAVIGNCEPIENRVCRILQLVYNDTQKINGFSFVNGEKLFVRYFNVVKLLEALLDIHY